MGKKVVLYFPLLKPLSCGKKSTLFPATNFFPDKVGNNFLFRKESNFGTYYYLQGLCYRANKDEIRAKLSIACIRIHCILLN